MAATVVDTSVKTATWAKSKPADYKGKDLDSALKALEALNGKGPKIPTDLPTMPKQSASAFESCVKEMQKAVTDMQGAVTYLKKMGAALQSVSSAASKTSTELQTLAKDKQDKEKKAYIDAAGVASGIGAQATAAYQKVK